MSRRSLVFALLLAFTSSAWAGGKVDWSQYIDKNPSAPVRSKSVAATDDAPPTTAKKAKSRKASKKKITKRKSKARSKARSRKR